MKSISYFLFIHFFLYSLFSFAQLNTFPTAGQLENDARVELKKVHHLLKSHFYEWGEYPTDFSVINYQLPTFLSKNFSISSQLNLQSFTVTFTGIASPMFRTFTIDQNGVLAGLTQFAAAHEFLQEVKFLLLMLYTAQKAHYAEYAEYSTDLAKLGVTYPSYLSRFGTLFISTTSTSFKVEFRGKNFPVQNKVFHIDQNKVLTGF